MTLHADEIAAYTYNAEVLCRPCMRRKAAFVSEQYGRASEYVGVEELLGRWAEVAQVERFDETTYDSDDFPKVVFAGQLEPEETCDNCGEVLP